MILLLLFVALIFAIALTQAKQGFFSALIMSVLTICCCAVAVCMHEWLAVTYLAEYWKPDFAHPLALGVTFAVPLLVLRLVFDRLIRRQCLLPAWVDRAGGGVCGIITAQIMVGMMALCVGMIPFGGSVMGYERVPVVRRGAAGVDASKIKADAPEREVWLMPDRFAAATASLLSGGIFSGQRSFYADNPDLVRASGWVNSAPLGVSRYAKPKSIHIAGTEPVQFLYTQTTGSEKDRIPSTYEVLDGKDVKSDRELKAVRVALLPGAKDERKSHMFSLRQFRLVGRSPVGGLIEQFAPIAIQQADASQPTNRHIRFIKDRAANVPVVDEVFSPRSEESVVEVVFELPKGFEPSFVEYKRGSRAAFPSEGASPPKEAAKPPKDAGAATDASAAPPTSGTTPSRRRATGGDQPAAGSQTAGAVPPTEKGGNIRGLTAQAGKSFFGDQLPMEMKSYRRIGDSEVSRGVMLHGHLAGEVEQQGAGTDAAVSRFDVPEGKRLLHLNTGHLQARSGLGRSISFAVGTLQNYTVIDDRGNAFPLVGKYAIANVANTRMVEVQYRGEDERGSIGGALGKFDRIKDDHLKGDYQLVMLFLVDPGVKIAAFSTGGDASRRDDLTGENLEAPR